MRGRALHMSLSRRAANGSDRGPVKHAQSPPANARTEHRSFARQPPCRSRLGRGAVSRCDIDNSLNSNVSERHRGTVVVQKGTSHYCVTVKHPELLTGLSDSAIGA